LRLSLEQAFTSAKFIKDLLLSKYKISRLLDSWSDASGSDAVLDADVGSSPTREETDVEQNREHFCAGGRGRCGTACNCTII
jgi:hypothetical protein